MKNRTLIAGCGIVLILLVGGGVAFYYLLYEPYLSDFVSEARRLDRIERMNAQIERTDAFTPPSGEQLTESQVERLVAVQHTVYDSVAAPLQTMVTEIKALAEKDRRGDDPSLSETLHWFRQFSGALTTAKRVQVNALNRHDFSWGEYRWVRTRVYQAAGWVVPPLGIERAMGRSQAGLQMERLKHSFEGEVPESNRDLVHPYREELERLMIVALFGL